MITSIIKRDGRETVFDQTKIADAIEKAFQASGAMQDRSVAEQITDSVMEKLEEGAIEGTPTVEGVQDLVEEALIEANFSQTAKAYILYRAERNRVRDVNSRLVQTLKDITFSKASDSDMKRERSEEHTSELQSPDHLVCRLLLEKKGMALSPEITKA